jgi:hypothetical protein
LTTKRQRIKEGKRRYGNRVAAMWLAAVEPRTDPARESLLCLKRGEVPCLRQYKHGDSRMTVCLFVCLFVLDCAKKEIRRRVATQNKCYKLKRLKIKSILQQKSRLAKSVVRQTCTVYIVKLLAVCQYGYKRATSKLMLRPN